MARVRAIAERTGLSKAVIAQYLNGGRVSEQDRAAIERAVQELDAGSICAKRGGQAKASYTVGVVIPEITNLFGATIVRALEQELHSQGHKVLVCHCSSDVVREAAAIHMLIEKGANGIVCLPTNEAEECLLPALEKELPVVLVDRMVRGLEGRVSIVSVDNVRAAQEAVSCLLDQGHTRIGMILGTISQPVAQQRLLGYRLALRQRMLNIDENLLCFTDYSLSAGYEAAVRLLDETDATAIVATSEWLTLGAMKAIVERGIRVPEEMSFVGFDRVPALEVVSLSPVMVEQPLEGMGKTAARLLLEQLSLRPDRRICVEEVLPTVLSKGKSVGKPREKRV